MDFNSIPEAFRQMARRMGDAPAVRAIGGNHSFAELDQASDAIATGLARQGIQKGERIGLYCINGTEFAMAYLGILKAGAIVVPVNLLLSPGEVNYILKDAGVRALFIHPAVAEKADRARIGVESLAFAVPMGGKSPIAGDIPLAQLMASQGSLPAPEFDPQADVAAVLYTAGTTGYPKGAQLTHNNLIANTANVQQALELQPGQDVLLVVLPMFHSFAATVGMLTPLLQGLSFAPVPKFDPGLVVDVIEATDASIFLGVPSMYGLFAKLPDDQVRRWQSVRFCVSGGAALPVAVLQAFERRFGLPILEGDGPTECGPVTCVNPLHGERKPGSVGLPLPNTEMCILDEKGEELPSGELAEVCVRSPSVMKGYLNLPDADAESYFGDWFRTGDLGYKDADGYIFLIDRKKDMIIVNGMNVYPRMVEEVLYRHPDIAEAAVVGEPHDTHGEIPVAHVVLKEGRTPAASEIRAWCREQLGQHQVPRKVMVRDVLPKNAAGKILKRELRKEGELERGVDSR